MTVKELIEMLQQCDENAQVVIDNTYEISMVWNCPTVGKVDITTVPTDEMLDDMEEENRDQFFLALLQEVEQGTGEMLDSLKINGVR